MQTLISDYPWMIVFIVSCAILFIVSLVLIVIIKTKDNDENINDEDKKQQKIIDEVLNEEKELAKRDELMDEENLEDVSQGSEEIQEDESPELNENNENEEDDDMYIKRKTTSLTVRTRTNITPAAKGSSTPKNKPVKQPEKRVVNGKYEVFEDGGQYKYILKASNGEILVESQQYASYDNVISAIDAVQRNLETGKYDITDDKRGLYQFVLKANNSRTLAVSASYNTKANAESALASFKRFAASSPIAVVDAPKKSTEEVIDIENVQPKLNGKITITKEGSKFVFNLVANNGEILCTSTPYASKSSCINGVDTFRTNIVDGRFIISRDKRKNYQFELYSQSNRLIAKGQTYEDKTRAISSANSVVAFIDNADIKE